METTASIKRHPLHVILVSFPIGLWGFSLICDLIYFFGWGGNEWRTVAYFTMAGGIISALVAAIPGFIDLLSVADLKLRRIGITHMVINLVVVILYIINFFMRRHDHADIKIPLILSIIGILLISVSGWLGGELVHVYRVSVSEGPLPTTQPKK